MTSDQDITVDHILANIEAPVYSLNLGSLGMQHLPEALRQFTDLQSLNLANNQLESLAGIEALTNLQYLNITGNRLRDLHGLEDMLDLDELYASENQLETLVHLGIKPKLRTLYVNHNRLTHLRGIEGLTNLRSLEAHHNCLSEIGAGAQTSLYMLDIRHNNLPSLAGIEALSGLEFLNANHNQITELRLSHQHDSLIELSIEHNQLTSLAGLEHLINLEKLYADNNKLAKLGVSTAPQKLNRMYLRDNQLTDLTGIETFSDLRQLFIENNQLTSLKTVNKHPELYYVETSGNPIEDDEDFYDDSYSDDSSEPIPQELEDYYNLKQYVDDTVLPPEGCPEVYDLLQPINDNNPVGNDLNGDYSHDSMYMQIKDARRQARSIARSILFSDDDGLVQESNSEIQLYYQHIVTLAPIILRDQSKDIEITCLYLEALLRLYDSKGLIYGLTVLRRVLETFWQHEIYPLPDEDGIETRVAAINGLFGAYGTEGLLIQPIFNLPMTVPSNSKPFSYYEFCEYRNLIRKRENDEPTFKAGFAIALVQTPTSFYIDLANDLNICLQQIMLLDKLLLGFCGHQWAPSVSKVRNVLIDFLQAVRYLQSDKYRQNLVTQSL